MARLSLVLLLLLSGCDERRPSEERRPEPLEPHGSVAPSPARDAAAPAPPVKEKLRPDAGAK